MDKDRFIEQVTTLDMNGDDRITITDIWEWLWQLAVMPGDVLIYLLTTYAPRLAQFFELSADHYGGSFSNFLSIGSWLVIFVIVSLVFNGLRSLDRALTARVRTAGAHVVRLVRIARRRIVSSIALRRSQRETAPGLEVSGVELGSLETAVLKCYASVDEFIVLTPREVSEKLNLSRRHVDNAVRRLGELRLVERSFGTNEGEEGHHISAAGQMYLIGG